MKRLGDAAFLLLVCASIITIHLPAQPLSSPVWTIQSSGTTASLRGIDSVDGKIAWASGTNGAILKTTDAGDHWTQCAIPDAGKDGATLDFRAIQARDATTAVVMASGAGSKSRLYKTIDGCKTWNLVFKNPDTPGGSFDSLRFHHEQAAVADHQGFGLLLGDPIKGSLTVFETRDGGHTWTRLKSPALAIKGLGSGPFAASNGCIFDFGTDSNFFVTGGRQGSYLLRLNYEGSYWANDASPLTRTWSSDPLPFPQRSASAGVFAIRGKVDLVEDQNAVIKAANYRLLAVGGDYTNPDETTGTAAYSLDNGQHWIASVTPPHGYRSSVAWSPDLKAWIAAGSNGSDISRDDGKTWTPFPSSETANGNWNALSLPFAVGPKGRIAHLSSPSGPTSVPKQ